MGVKFRRLLILMVFLLLETACLLGVIQERSKASLLKKDTIATEKFRRQELSPSLYQELKSLEKKGEDFGDLLSATMIQGGFSPKKISREKEVLLKYKQEEYLKVKTALEAIWNQVEYFPVASKETFFTDTFLGKRTYGGERLHEGTDIFGKKDVPGLYPILSMTDGVVEKIGWLPLGGWRIGIRAEAGGYFYYAHLSGYEEDFFQGQKIRAGDILGYMGNSGYGEKGTVGKFPVHLHLGIYIDGPDGQELSVNPYWVLQAMAENKNIINCRY